MIDVEEPAQNPTWPVRGEKQWQMWAQDHNDWLDFQTDRANSRPPYVSAVAWENDSPATRGEEQWDAYMHRNVANPGMGQRKPYIGSAAQSSPVMPMSPLNINSTNTSPEKKAAAQLNELEFSNKEKRW